MRVSDGAAEEEEDDKWRERLADVSTAHWWMDEDGMASLLCFQNPDEKTREIAAAVCCRGGFILLFSPFFRNLKKLKS